MEAAVEDSVCVYGSVILLKHLQALAQEVEGVQAGSEDIELIHRMRVASRRLRSAFPLFGGCLPEKKQKPWLRQIKKVTQALGQARDVDVQIERLQSFSKKLENPRLRPGVNRLLLRLQQTRQRLQPGVSQAMQDLLASQLIDTMTAYLSPLAARQDPDNLASPALYRHALNAVSTHLDDFLAFDQIVYEPEKVTELHAMRISAKRLRYTLENLASLYPNDLKPYLQAVRKAQELLGDIHDCDVWIAFLPEFMEEEKRRIFEFYNHTRSYTRLAPGLEAFLQDRRLARDKSYANFVEHWDAWKAKGLWNRLRQDIRAPFFQPAAPAVPDDPLPFDTR